MSEGKWKEINTGPVSIITGSTEKKLFAIVNWFYTLVKPGSGSENQNAEKLRLNYF